MMRSLLPLMLVLTACWASDPIFDNVSPQFIQEVLDNYRLPDDVIPIEYNIKLMPNFESSIENKNFTFEGWSNIILDINKNTSTITFHAKELDFFEKDISLTYIKEKKSSPLVPKFSKDMRKDFVTLTFDSNLDVQKKRANLSLHYIGKLNDELRGFYRSSYQNKEGKKMWLATTHFEPISARQAFPCWDEPHLKAYFTITIIVPQIKDYKAISNMPGKEENGVTIFNKTPKISTYLVAFVVSDFTALQNENKNFSVLANPTVEKNAKKFAFEYGLRVLEELKDFTNINYYETEQMIKMDQIAIPDFTAGAMENWGLVTYGEPRLLYYVNKTTTENKQAIATTIAHEFSHQWFGNLVTCEWWDYIWLKEGFATFFEYYISDKVIPKLDKTEKSWRLMEQFVIKNVQASSFVIDANSKTRALNPKNSVQTSTQIRSLFDDIAYNKGASILYMMYGFLSEDIFKKGLRQYLSDYKSKSVNSDKFFNSVQNSDKKLEEYLPKNVTLKVVMDNWVKESGYPVITVTWNKTLPGVVNITQERFFLVKPAKEDKTQWYIPINYVTEESPEKVMPIDKKSRWMIPGTYKSFDKLNNTKWILFNKDQTGYYRVNYDDSNWQLLATYLKSPNYANISAINRAQLIDDALNLARTGHLAYKTSLQITSYLSSETDYIPWYAAARAFNYLDSVLQGGKNYTAYRIYVTKKITAFASKANYEDMENGTHVDKLAKILALNMACKYGAKKCEDFVHKKLTEWLEKKNKENEKNFSPDLRSEILCAGLRKADAQTWNKTLQKYKTAEDKDEKADILAGLGCASNEIVQKFLQLTLEKDPIVDIFDAMNSICVGNAESFDILVKFINDNIEKIKKSDKEDNSLFIALLNKLSNRVITIEQYAELSLLVHRQLQEVEKFEGLAVAIYKLAWIKTYREEVETWIINNSDVCHGQKNSTSSITLMAFLLIISLLLTQFY